MQLLAVSALGFIASSREKYRHAVSPYGGQLSSADCTHCDAQRVCRLPSVRSLTTCLILGIVIYFEGVKYIEGGMSVVQLRWTIRKLYSACRETAYCNRLMYWM